MTETLTLAGGGGCCATPPLAIAERPLVDASFVRRLDIDKFHVDFLVPEMHCAACLTKIEGQIRALAGVTSARANLTTKRVGVDFDTASPDSMLRALEGLGYKARPYDVAAAGQASDDVETDLLRSMAVAGFAAANIMLLSVSVWSGAEAATRDLFHWLSALIALPAVVYAGRPFFRSAYRGLKARSLNMDFPISLGVTLASAMSLYETMTGGEHAWFDASVTLLFLLLVGRYLDHRMRDVARSAAARLLALGARSAMRLDPTGAIEHVPIGEIVPGDRLIVPAGDRIPIDGTVASGASDIDRSMLTGEAESEHVSGKSRVFAGTLNLTGPLTIIAAVKAKDTLLSDIVRLTENAERADSRLVRLADRASGYYAPAVHILAFATLAGWLLAGAGVHTALMAAVAVLIITCPCALGLAVPAVQVVAGGFLLKRGIMLKEGSALEKLAMVDTVAFDKTGTLTEGLPVLVECVADRRHWALAAALGRASRHPLALALARAAEYQAIEPAQVVDIVEEPGSGVCGRAGSAIVRLGRLAWVGGAEDSETTRSEIWLRVDQDPPLAFRFEDAIRPDAAEVLDGLRADGLAIRLLSGDRPQAVRELAGQLNITNWLGGLRPAGKARAIAAEEGAGAHVLMVGDGINDAPALASALVSMSPSTGSDITQTAANVVFTGRNLQPVATAIGVARAARRLMLQNFGLAIGYNALAVPIAMFGHATPLIAAVAMSTSSVLVTVNALRLPRLMKERRQRKPAQTAMRSAA